MKFTLSNPSRLRWAVDVGVLLAVLGFLFSVFTSKLLLSPTVTSGGDTPSHFFALRYLREVLLPHGQITGWTMANYAGFPLLEFYFPLPFLIMVAISYVVPMTVAFKIGTVLGIFLLPVSAYLCFRLLGFEFPAPALAAVFTLPFLFVETNSMWGGNIPSMLAGEFAYSLGFAFLLIWMGTLYRGITQGRGFALNAALLAVIGLTHGCPLLFAGVLSLFFLIEEDRFIERLLYLIKMHGLAFLLMSFWLIPTLAQSKWTTPFELIWHFESWKTEVFPPILLPLVPLWLFAFRWEGRKPTLFLAFGLLSALVLYAAAPKLGVPDIRFLPFTQLVTCLLAARGLAMLTRKLAGQSLIPILVLLAVVGWIGQREHFIAQWIDWNYTGFEGKKTWPVFDQVNLDLQGGVNDPRVVYENAGRNNMLGTTRAWETLPVYSGRSTLEHAYMQSSPSSPFVFYMQSEISLEASCPFPDYGCTVLNLARAEPHFNLFNISDFIVISDEAKAQIRKLNNFRLKYTVPPYEIYEVSGSHAYVVRLPTPPPVWSGLEDWRQAAYSWFRKPELAETPMVFPIQASDNDASRFPQRIHALSELHSQQGNKPVPVLEEHLSNEEITFEAPELNQPYWIKVSYHPNWKVEGADKIYLATPAFMLVYPTQHHVRLFYGRTSPDYLGMALSLLGFLLLMGRGRFNGGRWMPALSTRGARRIQYATWGIALGVTGLLMASSWAVRLSDPATLLAQGISFKDHRDWPRATREFRKVIASKPSSGAAEQAQYYLGIVPYLQSRWGECIDGFEQLLNQFPDSPHRAEAYFHLAMCDAGAGRIEDFHQRVKSLEQEYPQSTWAESARKRWPQN